MDDMISFYDDENFWEVLTDELGKRDFIAKYGAAAIKKMSDGVCGDADALLFPNIESGNVFYKCSTKFNKAECGAFLAGAKVPCVLSSRGDTALTKLYSIAIAATL